MDPREMERIISKVDGVTAVRVVGNGDSIKEIHVVTNGDKNPKQVVRDIETALFALTGLRIDRKVVSVAQMGNGVPKRKRVSLESIEVEEVGFEVEVSVKVDFEGEILEGRASGPKTSKGKMYTVAMAVLNAFNFEDKAVSIDDVRIARLNNEDFVLSLLSVSDGRGEHEVVGVSKYSDGFGSVARSILDALEKAI